MPDPLADLARLEGVASAVAATRDAIDLLVRNWGMRRTPPADAAAALLVDAGASARLNGDPDRWLEGTVRLATELIPLSDLILSAPAQVLARGHTLLAHGAVPGDRLGRLRADPMVVDRMQELTRLLTVPTAAPAMVQAAVAHAEIASTRPFGAGDDILARAVEHMVLVATGVDPGAIVVTAAGHARSGEEYRRALAGYVDGGLAGVRRWLLHCLEGMAAGAGLSPACH